MQRQVAVARRFGLAAIAYEAGQHLVGVGKSREDPHLNALFDAALPGFSTMIQRNVTGAPSNSAAISSYWRLFAACSACCL